MIDSSITITWYQNKEEVTIQYVYSKESWPFWKSYCGNDHNVSFECYKDDDADELSKELELFSSVNVGNARSDSIRSGVALTFKKKTPGLWPRLTKEKINSIKVDFDKAPFIEELDDTDMTEENEIQNFDTNFAIRLMLEEQRERIEEKGYEIAQAMSPEEKRNFLENVGKALIKDEEREPTYESLVVDVEENQ